MFKTSDVKGGVGVGLLPLVVVVEEIKVVNSSLLTINSVVKSLAGIVDGVPSIEKLVENSISSVVAFAVDVTKTK